MMIRSKSKTKQRLGREEFDSIYSRVPRLCVDLVIKTEERVVLSLRSIKPYQGWWHLPGGTVYFRESLEEAVRRVAEDECGLRVKVVKFLNYIEYPSYVKFSGEGHPISPAFLCRVIGGQLRGSEQGEVIKYFKKWPEKLIPEQKGFLEKIGVAI